MGAVADAVGDVFSAVGDAVGDVVDAVGDVVESVGDVVSDAVDFIGDTVQAVLDDPLPVILSVAGSFVGIPPMVTNAAITAARGGDLGDIALSVGTSYFAPTATNAISSTLTSAVGDAIVNEAVSETVVNAVSKGLVNGVIAETRGQDFEDGFAGGVTGTLVGSGVTELGDFVKPDVINSMTDLGIDPSTASQVFGAGTRAVTAGITSEVTGKGTFATSFTNSFINSTSNIVGNVASNTIADQFANATDIDRQITGAEEGSTKDQSELKTELTDAWANRDVNQVNDLLSSNKLTEDDLRTMFDLTDGDVQTLKDSGLSFFTGEDIKTTADITDAETGTTVGTGAGIPDTLVSEVETSFDGTDSGDASDVVSSVETKFITDDIGGGDSVSTVSGSTTPSTENDTSWFDLAQSGYQDVADIADTITTPTQEDQITPKGFEDLATAETTEPVGGLESVTQVAETEKAPAVEEPQVDVQDILASQTITPVLPDEEKTPDVAGGLNKFADTTQQALKTGLSTAVASGLKSALKQGITQSVRGAITRPTIKTVASRTPTPRTPTQTAATAVRANAVPTKAPVVRPAAKVDISKLKPVAKVAPPKKVDVRTLTPVSNIAGLTSILKRKV